MELSTATKFPTETNSDLFNVVVMGMGASPKERLKNDQSNLSPDGRKTFSTGSMLMVERRDYETGEIDVAPSKTDSVHSLSGVKCELTKLYKAQGKIWVLPYVSNGRLAYSITVEDLVEFNELNIDEFIGEED